MTLVSLDLIKSHINIAHDSSDVELVQYEKAATAAVLKYLCVDEIPDGAGADVQQAILILIAEFYKNREAEQQGTVSAAYGYGYLPQPVIAMLYPYRMPVIG